MSFSDFSAPKSSPLRAMPVYILHCLFLFLSMQTVNAIWVENVHVIFFLMPVFYWTVHRPNVLPLWFLFIAGLLIDFAIDSVLGLHAFGFIVLYILIYKIRRIILSQPLVYHIVIYGFLVFVFEFSRWGLLAILEWQMLSFFPFIMGFALNFVAFVPGVIILKMTNRFLSA